MNKLEIDNSLKKALEALKELTEMEDVAEAGLKKDLKKVISDIVYIQWELKTSVWVKFIEKKLNVKFSSAELLFILYGEYNKSYEYTLNEQLLSLLRYVYNATDEDGYKEIYIPEKYFRKYGKLYPQKILDKLFGKWWCYGDEKTNK